MFYLDKTIEAYRVTTHFREWLHGIRQSGLQ